MSETSALAGRASSARSSGGSPTHALTGGVDQHRRAVERGLRARSHGSARIGPPNSRASACARASVRLTSRISRAPCVDQADQHRARAAAGADHHDRAGIGAPAGLRLAHALDVAEGVVVLAVERSVGRDHDAVHRADAARERIDPVDDAERGLLVRNGQVAAGEAERRQRAQRGAQAVGLDRQRQVGAGQAVLRRANNCAASGERECITGQPITPASRKRSGWVMSRSAIGRRIVANSARLSTYCKLGTSFLTVSISAGGVE